MSQLQAGYVQKRQTLQKGESSYPQSSRGCFGRFDFLYLLPAPNLQQRWPSQRHMTERQFSIESMHLLHTGCLGRHVQLYLEDECLQCLSINMTTGCHPCRCHAGGTPGNFARESAVLVCSPFRALTSMEQEALRDEQDPWQQSYTQRCCQSCRLTEWQSEGREEKGEGQTECLKHVCRWDSAARDNVPNSGWSCTSCRSASRGSCKLLKCYCATTLAVTEACCFAILLEAWHT